MTVSLAPELLTLQTAARYEATRLHLVGGALVCHGGARPADGAPAPYPAIVRLPFAAEVGTVTPAGMVIAAPIEGQCLTAGRITWGRVETAAGAWVADFDAADLALDVVTVLPGAFVRLLAGAWR